MGMDGVELVMDIEERFGVSIADEDAAGIRTVGELCDYLRDRAKAFLATSCPTATAFYRLRRALIDGLGCARSEVKPATRLETLVPLQGRLRAWRQLSARLERPLPPLRWPTGVRRALVAWCWMVGLAPFVSLAWDSSWGAFFLLILLAIPLLLAGYLAACRCAVVIPAEAETMGALARTLVQRIYLATEREGAELEAWIEREVRDSIVEVLGVSPTAVHRDASFVNDLGLD